MTSRRRYRAEIQALQAEIHRLRAGADPTRPPEGTTLTPGQWIHAFLEADATRRTQIVHTYQQLAGQAHTCFLADHTGWVEELRLQVGRARQRITDLEATLAADLAHDRAEHAAGR